jgi:hypothetical protein
MLRAPLASFRRLPVLIAASLLLGVALAPAGHAQTSPGQDYDIVDKLAEAFETEAGQQFTKQFLAGEAKVFTDPEGDFIHPTGPEPGFTPPYVDIREVIKTGKAMPGQDASEYDRFFSSDAKGGPWCDPNGFGSNPEIMTVCSPEWDGNPTPYRPGALVSGTVVEAPIPIETPPGGCEVGFWTYTPSLGPAFRHSAGFPKDPADGMNAGLILRGNALGDWSMVSVRLNESGQFEPVPTRAVAAIYEDQVAIFKPLQELGNLTRAQYHVFCANGERTDPKTSGGDILGPVDVDLASLATVTFTGIAPPKATTAPSAATEKPETPGAVPTGAKSNLPYLSLIGTGIILFLAGLFLLLRRKRGMPEPPPTEDHYTPTAQPMVGEPIEPPTIPVGVPKTETRDVCDWALYFEDGKKGKVRLRAAQGQECCVYELRVATSTLKDAAAFQGRQEPHMVGGTVAVPKGRLRIPDLELVRSGLDMKMTAGVRSGPAGNLDWMHGYGEPELSDDIAIEPYRQNRPHEEPPDVVAHFDFAETTRVTSTLSSDCPGHENKFDLVADRLMAAGSRVTVNADEECTNHAPGECPVELSADGGGALAVVGPIQYWARHVIGSSPDEIERNVKEPIPDVQFPDPKPPEVSGTLHQPHDHQERAHYAGKAEAGDGTTQQGDAITLDVFNSGVLDVGIIVPMAVWPATGRVTSAIETSCDHGIVLAGKMKRKDCVNVPCCGNKRCICKPAFSLEFDKGKAVLTVEGKKHEIERQALRPKVGFEHVWVLK